MSNHTPTPWVVGEHYKDENSDTFIIPIGHDYDGGFSGEDTIAEIWDTNNPGYANAEFIVKACNNHDVLASAVGGLLTACALASMDGVAVPADAEACKQARKALKTVKS